MESIEIDITSIPTHTKIPVRVKGEIAWLQEDKEVALSFLTKGSRGWPYQIKITKSFTFVCNIHKDHPFHPPSIILEGEEEDLAIIQESINAKLVNTWAPRIRLVDIIEMISAEIKTKKQRESFQEDVDSGNVYTLEEIKEKYLVEYEFAGKYPEFQEKRYGLWAHGLGFGYILFYIEGDWAYFVDQSKSKRVLPTISRCTYALDFSKSGDKYDLHVADDDGNGKTHRFNVLFHGNGIMSMTFFHLHDDSVLGSIIPYTTTDCIEFVLI